MSAVTFPQNKLLIQSGIQTQVVWVRSPIIQSPVTTEPTAARRLMKEPDDNFSDRKQFK